MPELCQNYARLIPESCQESARLKPELCQKHGRIYTRSLPEICQNYLIRKSNAESNVFQLCVKTYRKFTQPSNYQVGISRSEVIFVFSNFESTGRLCHQIPGTASVPDIKTQGKRVAWEGRHPNPGPVTATTLYRTHSKGKQGRKSLDQ